MPLATELLVPPGLPADDPPVRAIRDARYKLIHKETGSLPIQELFFGGLDSEDFTKVSAAPKGY